VPATCCLCLRADRPGKKQCNRDSGNERKAHDIPFSEQEFITLLNAAQRCIRTPVKSTLLRLPPLMLSVATTKPKDWLDHMSSARCPLAEPAMTDRDANRFAWGLVAHGATKAPALVNACIGLHDAFSPVAKR
jgi:hypothetical protein